jgi:4-amino-4-deoxy-L-arabinose transferase-like glycosyltransferase
MKKFLTRYGLLLGIIFLASLLRFWQLGQVPLGFHHDEAAYGYNTYSILATGKDEYGENFPLLLKSFGEYKPALYSYLSAPWVAIFDLNAFSVRATAALFGALSVIMLYFLTDKLLRNETISLLATFLLTISPWHLNLSRTASEVVVSLFFILVLVYALTFLKEKFTSGRLALAIIAGVLAIETYTASRFFVVILTGLWFLTTIKMSGKKIMFNTKLLIICVVFVLIGAFVSFMDGANRFSQISITTSTETQLVLDEQIREDEFAPSYITRAFHNKVVNYTRTLVENYSEYLSFKYLFLEGGFPQRMHLTQTGLFYFWQLPFLILGLYMVLKNRNVVGFFLLSWIAFLLIPASFTFDEIPNVYRSLVILPPLLILIATGVHTLLSTRLPLKIIKPLLIALIILVAVWEFAYYQHQYYDHQEKHQPWYRGYAYQELTAKLRDLYGAYKEIIITKSHESPYIYLLFYYKYDPALYQNYGSPRDLKFSGFDKYRFTPMDCPLSLEAEDPGNTTMKEHVLYVNKGDCPMPATNVKLIKTIYWQDNTPAFQLLEYASKPASI